MRLLARSSLLLVFLLSASALSIACGATRGPIVDTGNRPANVGGTIAGLVRASGNAPLAGRTVTAVETQSGARFDATTATNGGYTLQVPAGTYRLEVELRAGERLETQPESTQVNVGDLDSDRNFLITAGAR